MRKVDPSVVHISQLVRIGKQSQVVPIYGNRRGTKGGGTGSRLYIERRIRIGDAVGGKRESRGQRNSHNNFFSH